MGTRGWYGFYYKGKHYWFYNQYDSYPSGLGHYLVQQIKQALRKDLLKIWKQKILALVEVSAEDVPTKEQIFELREYTDFTVSEQPENWYCLLRECQGNYEKTLNAGYIYSAGDNYEYTYLLNLDENTFEFHNLHTEFKKSYPLTDLPDFQDPKTDIGKEKEEYDEDDEDADY